MRAVIRPLMVVVAAMALFVTPLDAQRDVLVSRAGDGAFWKWYGGPPVGPEFPGHQAGRFIGGGASAVPHAQMIPMNFNGDPYQDVLVFRSLDGAFWKWYGGGPAMSPDFSNYHPTRYIGGSAGAVAGAQMIPMNFNGDPYQDVLVFRSSDGAFWRWYGGPGVSPDFSSYQPARYIGGRVRAVVGAQMIPMNFDCDQYQDVLVFRSSDGAFWKWYGGPGVSPDFSSYQPGRYIGGQPGVVPGARMTGVSYIDYGGPCGPGDGSTGDWNTKRGLSRR